MAKLCVKLLIVVSVLANSKQSCVEEVAQVPDYRQRFMQTRTTNATITCTHVSLNNLNYKLDRKSYDQFLNISQSTIRVLPPFAFSDYRNAAKLFLRRIGIAQIFPGAFTGLTSLKELHLDGNDITELIDKVFNSLRYLRVLNLSRNKIDRFEKGAFVDVANLEELYLGNNRLSRVEEGAFETLHKLRLVDLSDNPLIVLGKKFPNLNDGKLILTKTLLTGLREDFHNLTIKELDMVSSRFTSINFANFPKTEMIDLRHNRIVALTNCSQFVSKFARLDNNDIETIDGIFSGLSNLSMSHNKLNNLTHFGFGYERSREIQLLDFSNNNISRIAKTLFRRMISLEELFLQNNRIVTLDVSLFADLSNMRVLNLSHNEIEKFQYGIFDNLEQLEILDISSNRLLDLPQFAFHSLSNLQVLNFADNEISSVKEVALRHYLPRLVNVSLDKNPWNCDDLVMLSYNLALMSVRVQPGADLDVENFRGVACHHLKGGENKTELSFDVMAKNVQRTLDEAVAKSKMARFFNRDFENSNFYKFFKRYETMQGDGSDGKHVEELSVEDVEGAYMEKVFVSGLVIQVVVLGLILFMICLIYRYIKNNKMIQEKRRSLALSDMSYF